MECYETVPEGTQISKISILAIDWKADGTPESDWSGSQKAGGNTYGNRWWKKQGATEELKAQDQMKWVRLMINIKIQCRRNCSENTIYM